MFDTQNLEGMAFPVVHVSSFCHKLLDSISTEWQSFTGYGLTEPSQC